LLFSRRDKAFLNGSLAVPFLYKMLLHRALIIYIFFHFHIKKQFPEVPYKSKYNLLNGFLGGQTPRLYILDCFIGLFGESMTVSTPDLVLF